jgi:hypothetical protein
MPLSSVFKAVITHTIFHGDGHMPFYISVVPEILDGILLRDFTFTLENKTVV